MEKKKSPPLAIVLCLGVVPSVCLMAAWAYSFFRKDPDATRSDLLMVALIFLVVWNALIVFMRFKWPKFIEIKGVASFCGMVGGFCAGDLAFILYKHYNFEISLGKIMSRAIVMTLFSVGVAIYQNNKDRSSGDVPAPQE